MDFYIFTTTCFAIWEQRKKIYTDKMASFRDYIEALVGTSSQNIIVAEV